jgi:hypothetical protein
MARAGKQFEEAAHSFVQQLGEQSATVVFDQKVPDRDTDTLRQVDAWVEAKFKGHFPFKVLISCKDWKHPLDIDDIGCLCDQVRSTGANLGIVYSRNGFTGPALLKAKKNSINCCRLYENQPADTPDVLIFASYCATPQIRIGVKGKWSRTPHPKWGDLFGEVVATEGGEFRVVDRLAELFDGLQRPNVEHESRAFPKSRALSWHIVQESVGMDLTIDMHCEWKLYRGKVEAHRVQGSYCLTDGNFAGSQIGPAIDTQSGHPGPDWEEIDPEVETTSVNRILAMMCNGADRFKEWAQQTLWDKTLFS